jgi:hypothetical protein
MHSCLPVRLFDVRISGNLTHADVIERFDLEIRSSGVFDEAL